MRKSSETRKKSQNFTAEEIDQITRLAWEDKITFESIYQQFRLTANEVVKFMRAQLDDKTYKRWRRRLASQGYLKHESHKKKTGKSKSSVAKDSMEQVKVGSKIIRF